MFTLFTYVNSLSPTPQNRQTHLKHFVGLALKVLKPCQTSIMGVFFKVNF